MQSHKKQVIDLKLNSKYLEYIKENGYLSYDNYVYNIYFTKEQRQKYLKYRILFVKKANELAKQNLYPAVISKIIKQRIIYGKYPKELSIFLRSYPKQYNIKDKRNFYGL